MAKQTPHMKPPMHEQKKHCNRRNALERSIEKILVEKRGGDLNKCIRAKFHNNFAAPNYKHMFG